MNESTTKPRRWVFVALFIVAAVGLFIYLRVRPIVVAESHSPHWAGGYIRIVETPTSWPEAILFRYNPFYRFEYYWPRNYLWSAASFSGESYNAKKATIIWNSDSTATVFLDDYPYFELRERLWHAPK